MHRRTVHRDVLHRPGWVRAGTAGLAALIAGGVLAGGAAAAHAAAPGAPPAPPPRHPSIHAAPQATPCVSALDGSLQPFTAHLRFAHLERQVPDQLEDIKATNQYVLTHTVLVQAMAAPLQEGLSKVLGGTLGPFFTHLRFAHLERSPFEQVEDIKATDRYVRTHTALVEAMAAPTGEVLGACG